LFIKVNKKLEAEKENHKMSAINRVGTMPVVLHIYDLTDQAVFCCGFFHTGVLVNGMEWTFGAGGGIG